MAVRIADKLQQFNNGTYYLVDSSAVEYIDKNGDSHSVKDILDNGIDELSKEDVERLLGLTKEEIEAMADLILDTEVRLNKTYSSSKIHSDIQDAIDSSKSFTLAEIGKMSGASYKVVTSTTEMTDEKIIYLLENGTTYDMYIVETDGTVTKIGDTTIDLSSYLKVTDAESAYLKKTEATSTYATQTSFNNHITDTVAHLTQLEKNKLLTTDNITSTINNSSDNTQVPTAKATYDLANKKANKTHTHNTSDIKGLSIPSNVSELTNDAGYISEVINTLTSTDTDKPLSANQGKVLKDEVDLKANDSEVVKKTDIATTIDLLSTDEQVASAKAVYDGMENINDFSVQVVKEKLDLNDMTETGIYYFSQTYTPVNIPVGVNGWLLVMKGSSSDIVKQVWYRLGTANSNSYNTFERYKGNNTWSEWTKFLTEKEYYNALDYGNPIIPQDADLNDYLTPGVYTCMSSTIANTLLNCPHIDSNFKLIVNKNRGNDDALFYGYQMIVGTKGGNPVTDVCVYYRGISVYNNVCVFSKWKIMSGSTVADVKETPIEFDKTALGLTISGSHSSYKVINGICYVTIELNVVPPSNDKTYGYTKISTTILPRIGFSTKAILNVVETSSSISAVLDRGDTCIKLHGNILGREGSCVIQGSFSYPVAE